MASGNVVLTQPTVLPPATLTARPVVLNGASTPAERVLVWRFPTGASGTDTSYLDILYWLKGYSGGGITLRFGISSDVTANNAVMQAAFRRWQADTTDLDTSHSYSYQTTTIAVPTGSANRVAYGNISFSNSQIDGVVDNEQVILRVYRDAAHASDSLANNSFVYLWNLPLGFET